MKLLLTALIIVCFPAFSYAQTSPVIKNLVFEGAGIRGVAYCGVISELESNGILPQIEKVAGTSAGAIVALTVSLGYNGEEIESIISETDFKQFNDGKYFFAGGINRTRKYFGWYRGRQFEKWLENIITQKTGNAEITFAELTEKRYKDLYITGTCLNKQQLVIFSKETYPKMKVKDAVRISMSIPLYYEAVFIDAEGNVIDHPRNKSGLDVMVDGGFTGNFPVKLFDTDNIPNPFTVGFRIDSEQQIKNDIEDKNLAPMAVNNFKQYVNAFYNIVIENLNRQQLNEDDWKRTVSISDGKIGPKIKRLSDEEKRQLILNGKKATQNYLNR